MWRVRIVEITQIPGQNPTTNLLFGMIADLDYKLKPGWHGFNVDGVSLPFNCEPGVHKRFVLEATPLDRPMVSMIMPFNIVYPLIHA